jgi:hypothetical protein
MSEENLKECVHTIINEKLREIARELHEKYPDYHFQIYMSDLLISHCFSIYSAAPSCAAAETLINHSVQKAKEAFLDIIENEENE